MLLFCCKCIPDDDRRIFASPVPSENRPDVWTSDDVLAPRPRVASVRRSPPPRPRPRPSVDVSLDVLTSLLEKKNRCNIINTHRIILLETNIRTHFYSAPRSNSVCTPFCWPRRESPAASGCRPASGLAVRETTSIAHAWQRRLEKSQ